jgi:hypothetical protein
MQDEFTSVPVRVMFAEHDSTTLSYPSAVPIAITTGQQ